MVVRVGTPLSRRDRVVPPSIPALPLVPRGLSIWPSPLHRAFSSSGSRIGRWNRPMPCVPLQTSRKEIPRSPVKGMVSGRISSDLGLFRRLSALGTGSKPGIRRPPSSLGWSRGKSWVGEHWLSSWAVRVCSSRKTAGRPDWRTGHPCPHTAGRSRPPAHRRRGGRWRRNQSKEARLFRSIHRDTSADWPGASSGVFRIVRQHPGSLAPAFPEGPPHRPGPPDGLGGCRCW